MQLKACELRLLSKQYDKLPQCIKTYEKIAKKYLAQPLLKSNAKSLFFLASLCYMANKDAIGAKKQIGMYSLDDPTFEGSRECSLVQNLLAEIENKNSDGFTNAISDYNQITPFSKL